MKVSVVLYGTGLWAEKHLMAYALCPGVEVVGLVGHSDEVRLKALAATYGVPRTFMELGQALAQCKPVMLDVSCNPHFRLQAVEAVVGTSVRHVNLEKPMALKPSEAMKIAALCRQHHLTLTVNHQKKFNAPWAKARTIIEGDSLGKICFFRATCKGNLLEQGTHLVDMLLFFQGYGAIDWIMGCVDDLDGLDKSRTSAPDSAVAHIRFANGVHGHLALGNVGWDLPRTENKWFHMGVETYGEAGHLSIALNDRLSVTTYATGKTVEEPSSWDDTFLQGIADHLGAAARYAMGEERTHISCLDHSLLSFEAVMGIYKSACGDGRVQFPAVFDDNLIERLRARHRAAMPPA